MVTKNRKVGAARKKFKCVNGVNAAFLIQKFMHPQKIAHVNRKKINSSRRLYERRRQ